MPSTRTTTLSAALPALLFLTIVVFLAILPRLLLAPLLLRIADSFETSYSRVSGLFMTGSFGFVAGLLTSGFVANRLRHRWTIIVSLGLNAITMIGLSLVGGLAAFHAIYFVTNWASGLYPGSGIASVTEIAPEKNRGTALAIHESGPNLAFLTAPVLVALLAPHLGWRGVFQVAGFGALAVTVLFAFFGRTSSDRGQSPRFSSITLFAKSRSFWIVSILFIVAASGAMGVFSVLPTYLIVEHGLGEQLVNTLVGLSRISGFASILLVGTLADRFGFVPVVSIVLGTTGLVTLAIGLTEGLPLLIAVFLQPLLVGAFFPLGLSALSDVAPPQARNLAVALAIPLANFFGSGLTPRLMSWAGELGHFPLSFVVLGGLTVASLLLLRGYAPKPTSVPPPAAE